MAKSRTQRCESAIINGIAVHLNSPKRKKKISQTNRSKNRKSSKNVVHKRKRSSSQRLTKPPINRLESSTGVNFYNRNKSTGITGQKRLVLLDGSNVAYAYTNNKTFSVTGIKIALRFFEKKNHETYAVVPDLRVREFPELKELEDLNKLIVTPCKDLPGKRSTSYDDRFILQLAVDYDAAVISRDNYRDLVDESPAFKKIIENQVIGFLFFKDMFMLPVDPYGRNGPKLEEILNRQN